MVRYVRRGVSINSVFGRTWHVVAEDGLTLCRQDLENAGPVVYYDGVTPPTFDRVKTICKRCQETHPPEHEGLEDIAAGVCT